MHNSMIIVLMFFLLGKQDSINQERLLDDYCEIIEHDVQQESEYISCVRPISFSQLMLR